MTALRRAAFALAVAVLGAILVRLKASSGRPPQTGGWRELPVEDLDVPEPLIEGSAGPAGPHGPG